MGACIIAGSLFYGNRHKIGKLLSLGIIIAGFLRAIVGDSEASFLWWSTACNAPWAKFNWRYGTEKK